MTEQIDEKPTYARKGHIILNRLTGKGQDFNSVNDAKKESRRLQEAGYEVRRIPRKTGDRLKSWRRQYA